SAAALATMVVAVVGAGGLGWLIAVALANHGVGRVIAIDHDTIAIHNRPRLPGSRASQVGMQKVDALAELIAATRPDPTVIPVAAPLADRRARAAIACADAVVVATDSLTSRLDADRFAPRVLVPLVDVGVNVE